MWHWSMSVKIQIRLLGKYFAFGSLGGGKQWCKICTMKLAKQRTGELISLLQGNDGKMMVKYLSRRVFCRLLKEYVKK